MQCFSAVLTYTVILCLFLPGMALKPRRLHRSHGVYQRVQEQYLATTLRGCSGAICSRIASRFQNPVYLMPLDDGNEEQQIRSVKSFVSTSSLVDQEKVSPILSRLSSSCAPNTPLFLSLCALLI